MLTSLIAIHFMIGFTSLTVGLYVHVWNPLKKLDAQYAKHGKTFSYPVTYGDIIRVVGFSFTPIINLGSLYFFTVDLLEPYMSKPVRNYKEKV